MTAPIDTETAYHELYAYTMGRPKFILQHVVDAYGAQGANASSKPIGIVFCLVGLFLHIEKGFTGTQVQQAHIRLGREKRQWPVIPLPALRGSLTPVDVMEVPAGPDRDAAIDKWCESVWAEYHASRNIIIALLEAEKII